MNINKIHLLVLALTAATGIANAQTVNWMSLQKDQKHIVNLHIAGEHGLVFGAGYGRQFSIAQLPVIVQAEYSQPAGNQIFDDFKTKLGAQVRVFKFNNIQVSAKAQGIYRRYQNDLSRLQNFGSDMSLTTGYYRRHWYAAGDIGFDKAIVTHIKHSEDYRAQYDGAKDGWYEPSTGGNFYFGIQGGYSIRHYDIYIKGGRLETQDLKSAPAMPYYGQLGCNIRF
jgi:hypothetical protein